jgi:hypothetical protein
MEAVRAFTALEPLFHLLPPAEYQRLAAELL